jgi:hypothetical protein
MIDVSKAFYRKSVVRLPEKGMMHDASISLSDLHNLRVPLHDRFPPSDDAVRIKKLLGMLFTWYYS